MPSPIRNNWTLKEIVQNTYKHLPNRFAYRERDVLKRVIVKEVKQVNLSTNRVRTTFRIETQSYPQYPPYYTGTDVRGRTIMYQRSYRHEYDSVLQLDRLSINVPFKARIGADRKWDFSPRARVKKDRKTGKILRESLNVERGINGDFFFRCSYLWREAGILFGRNYAVGYPRQVNPQGIIFAPKHFLRIIKFLMDRGILLDN